MNTSQTRDFFDKESVNYRRNRGNRAHHQLTARVLESSLSGRVLSAGGPWPESNLANPKFTLTIADASRGMLDTWAHLPAERVQADIRSLPFPDGHFDHMVLPLVLHHLAEKSARDALENVTAALTEARRLLRPGGTLWISEFTLPESLYRLERHASPWAARGLSLANIPLVVMHPARVYTQILRDAGWVDLNVDKVAGEGVTPFDIITPIIGLDWFRVPRFLYPLSPVLIRARRPDK